MIARLRGPKVRELRCAKRHNFTIRNFLALSWAIDGCTKLESGRRQGRRDDRNHRTVLSLIAKGPGPRADQLHLERELLPGNGRPVGGERPVELIPAELAQFPALVLVNR